MVQMRLLLEGVEGKGKSVNSGSEIKKPARAEKLLSLAKGVGRSKETKAEEPKKVAKKETK